MVFTRQANDGNIEETFQTRAFGREEDSLTASHALAALLVWRLHVAARAASHIARCVSLRIKTAVHDPFGAQLRELPLFIRFLQPTVYTYLDVTRRHFRSFSSARQGLDVFHGRMHNQMVI